MTNTITFNTGRRYTKNGQEITATLHDDGCVTFWDKSRMVGGEFDLMGDTFGERVVMEVYDRGHFAETARARADGMYHGGCNT